MVEAEGSEVEGKRAPLGLELVGQRGLRRRLTAVVLLLLPLVLWLLLWLLPCLLLCLLLWRLLLLLLLLWLLPPLLRLRRRARRRATAFARLCSPRCSEPRGLRLLAALPDERLEKLDDSRVLAFPVLTVKLRGQVDRALARPAVGLGGRAPAAAPAEAAQRPVPAFAVRLLLLVVLVLVPPAARSALATGSAPRRRRVRVLGRRRGGDRVGRRRRREAPTIPPQRRDQAGSLEASRDSASSRAFADERRQGK